MYIVKNNEDKYYEQDAFGFSWTTAKKQAHLFTTKENAIECTTYFKLEESNIELVTES